jgi:hypothetical protein
MARFVRLVPSVGLWLFVLSLPFLTGCSGGAPPASQVQSAAPASTPSSSAPSVVAYVFTSDSVKQTASEFALSSVGKLQATTQSVPYALPVATDHGVVYSVPGQGAGKSVALQSYALQEDGSLQPEGGAATYPQDKTSTLVSDNTYVYAVSDEGIFGFTDQRTGLTPLPASQQTVPSPCPPAQENIQYGCGYSAALTLSNGNAFLSERNIPPYGTENTFPQLSEFTRVQGQLTDQQLISSYVGTYLITATPDGRFLYLLEWISNRILRYNIGDGNALIYSPLSNGQQLQSPGTESLFVTPNGKFLLASIQNGASPGQVRVFQIDTSSGNLTEISGSPFSTGENYLQNMALDPTGHYLLGVHSACSASADPNCSTPGRLVAMSIDNSTGVMSVTSDVADGVEPRQVTAALVSQ